MYLHSLWKALKKTIESVIMSIAGRGKGLQVVITPLRFFLQCSKPSCLALLSPKTNFVLIQKFQFHTIFNISDHIDLDSFTLFRRGMIMITNSMGFLSLP